MDVAHRCLSIAEILSNIFEHNNDSRPTLASLARTCRTFHEPALTVLWFELPSMLPLITCLPGDLWKRRNNSVDRYQIKWELMLERPTGTRDWMIFRKYARRVRRLYFNTEDRGCSINVEFILALCNPPTTTPLFPNLRQLWYLDRSDIGIAFAHRVLGPKIVELTMSVTTRTSPQSLILSLPTICPSLKIVRLHIPFFPSPPKIENMSDALCQLTQVEELECGPLNKAALRHVAGLKSLRHLSFFILEQTIFSDIKLDDHIFPNLEELILFSDSSFGSFSGLLQHLRSLPKIIRLYFNELHCGIVLYEFRCSALYELLSMISTKPSQENLEEFHICEQSDLGDMSDENPGVITIETLRPLLALSRLQRVCIDCPCPISLDDTSIEEMATAWPELRQLILDNEYRFPNQSYVTIEGLITLLRLCPNLHTLTVPIDATNIASFASGPHAGRLGGGVCNTNITELNLCDSKIDDPATVAAIFADILPCVRHISVWSSRRLARLREAHEYKTKWNIVVVLLEALAEESGDEGILFGEVHF